MPPASTVSRSPTRILGEHDKPTAGRLKQSTTTNQTQAQVATTHTNHTTSPPKKTFQTAKQKRKALEAVGSQIYIEPQAQQKKTLRCHIDPAARWSTSGGRSFIQEWLRIITERHYDSDGSEARARSEHRGRVRVHDEREYRDGGWRRERNSGWEDSDGEDSDGEDGDGGEDAASRRWNEA